MSASRTKSMRRMVNKAVQRSAADLYQDLNEMPLTARVRAAWRLVCGRLR